MVLSLTLRTWWSFVVFVCFISGRRHQHWAVPLNAVDRPVMHVFARVRMDGMAVFCDAIRVQLRAQPAKTSPANNEDLSFTFLREEPTNPSREVGTFYLLTPS